MQIKKPQFRCSQLGRLMTNPRDKADKEAGRLGDTAKTYVEEVWLNLNYGRKKTVTSKYFEKGISAEDDAIALLSAHHNAIFKKNTTRYESEYLSGTPDVDEAEIFDTKCNWDIFKFFEAELCSEYEWQLRGYMMLANKEKATLAYCLINTPEHILQSEIEKARYPLKNAIKYSTDQEIHKRLQKEEEEMTAQIYRNSTFDDIPLEQRIKLFPITRDLEIEKKIEAQIAKAVNYYYTLQF